MALIRRSSGKTLMPRTAILLFSHFLGNRGLSIFSAGIINAQRSVRWSQCFLTDILSQPQNNENSAIKNVCEIYSLPLLKSTSDKAFYYQCQLSRL